MKKTLTLILAGAAAFAFTSCTTVVHPTQTRTVYKKVPTRTYSSSRPASVSSRIYDSPENTTVVRPAE